LKRVWLAIFLIATFGVLASCSGTRVLMQTAPSKPKGAPAHPKITPLSLSEWQEKIPTLQTAFEQEVYGIMPRGFDTHETASRPITDHSYNADIKEVILQATYTPEASPDRIITYKAVIVTPKDMVGPVPIIMMENFCPNHAVIPADDITKPSEPYFDCSGDGFMGGVFGYFFGRYITTPPIDMIMERGYALAVIYPGETFPDSAARFIAQRAAPSSRHPWGAIAAWAWQFSSLSHYLDTDGRFSQTLSYGHSRYGKSALLAAAFDPAIDGVIAHQSGTGGASLSREKPGESVADITAGYPHWFTPVYAEDRLTIDQHHLLALIAPRPVLLGNARRDVWSDPNGAFRAAQAATPVYTLYGKNGLQQKKLTEFNPQGDIAFWIRPGTHGVVKEDWPAFLAFIDAHFKQ